MSVKPIVKNQKKDSPNITKVERPLESAATGGMVDIQLCSLLSDCGSIDEFRTQVSAIVNQLGFSDFTFTTLSGKTVGRITSTPKALNKQYLNGGFVEHDMFLEHAAVSSHPLYLSDLDQYISNSPFSSERINQNKALFELLAQHGYHDCYCVPRRVQNQDISVMFTIFDKDATREDFRRKVELGKPLLGLLIDAVVYFGISKFPENIICGGVEGNVPITPKPLWLLSTMAKEGLMLKEAAVKLCISVDTANKHIAAAKQALGASTLANAVYRAMQHGLIEKDDD